MSYFGQRLKIYFSCEQEQLSNRLIMILETQELSPAPWAALVGSCGSLRWVGQGPQCNVPP